MITALVFVLAGGLAEIEAPREPPPPPVSIMDLFADGEPGWSEEPEHLRRCRLYRCGLPRLQLEKLLEHKDRSGEPERQ